MQPSEKHQTSHIWNLTASNEREIEKFEVLEIVF